MALFIARFVGVQLLSLGAFAQHGHAVAGSWENSDQAFSFESALHAIRDDAHDDDGEEDAGSVLLRLLSASSGPGSNSSNTSTSAPSSNSTHKVVVTMNMDVDDADAYVADTANVAIIEDGLATKFSVPASSVTATLEAKTRNRRLSITAARRLTTKYVEVDADISVADAATATSLQTTVSGTSAADLQTAVAAAYTSAGVTMPAGLSVTSVSATAMDGNTTITSTARSSANHAKMSSSLGSVTAAVCMLASAALALTV